VLALVEDNADDEELTLRAFRRAGLPNRVQVLRDGGEAVDYLLGTASRAAQGGPARVPHVVLLDLKLPRIDGLEVLRRLRADERTKLLPVIVLTASEQDRDIVESYGLGADGYIVKPVDMAKLEQAVEQLGLYWVRVEQDAPGA